MSHAAHALEISSIQYKESDYWLKLYIIFGPCETISDREFHKVFILKLISRE